jgi:transposase-like protein
MSTTPPTTTRAEREEIAHELRSQGLKIRQITERMGVARSTVYAWFEDPGGSKLRARKATYQGRCEHCGDPTSGNGGPVSKSKRCAACARAVGLERRRQRAKSHREAVEQAWADGKTYSEMAEMFGWSSPSYYGQLRHRGYKLPHRPGVPRRVPRVTPAVLAGRIRAAEARRKRIVKTCESCGASFEVIPSEAQRKACNRSCSSKLTWASRGGLATTPHQFCNKGHALVDGNLHFEGTVRRCLTCYRAKEQRKAEQRKKRAAAKNLP